MEVKQRPEFSRWQWEWEREIKQKPQVRHWEGDLYSNSGLSEMEMRAKKSSQWLTNSPLRDYVNGGSVAKKEGENWLTGKMMMNLVSAY